MQPFWQPPLVIGQPRQCVYGPYTAKWTHQEADRNSDRDEDDTTPELRAKWTVHFYKHEQLLFSKLRNDYHHSYPHEFVVVFVPGADKDEPYILFHEKHAYVTVMNTRGETLFHVRLPDFIAKIWYIHSDKEDERYLVFEEWVWTPIDFVGVCRLKDFLEPKEREPPSDEDKGEIVFSGESETFATTAYTDGADQMRMSKEGVRFNVMQTSQCVESDELPADDPALRGEFYTWAQLLEGVDFMYTEKHWEKQVR